MSYQHVINELTSRLHGVGIIPILAPDDPAYCLKMCESMLDNGFHTVEIHFGSAYSERLIREAVGHFPELRIGAETILSVRDLNCAFDAGADFAVSPGFNPKVAAAAVDGRCPFAPGIMTPSELEQANSAGCLLLNIFPAEAAGGIKMLKALIAQYRHLPLNFIPVLEDTADNAAEYLALPRVTAIGVVCSGETGVVSRLTKLRDGIK